ncbi:hypothetical protein TIFTF001_014846 [Ficus carica]|uniref:Uncharacterized protein n=1 Tax=Ficus carica TaxID=3494 RepID=A0AA88AKJ3_FICCA|nr:hypothetical protein TIFTF001_014846 [Ficus carica]
MRATLTFINRTQVRGSATRRLYSFSFRVRLPPPWLARVILGLTILTGIELEGAAISYLELIVFL